MVLNDIHHNDVGAKYREVTNMVKAYDVDQNELVGAIAVQLQKDGKISMPEWANFVKTGNNKERPPIQSDWWFRRAASILKRVYTQGPIGVEKLRTVYGSAKNRGVRPGRFVKSGGKLIRVLLQQLEDAKYVAKEEKSLHRGRKITPQGMSLVDKAAGSLKGAK